MRSSRIFCPLGSNLNHCLNTAKHRVFVVLPVLASSYRTGRSPPLRKCIVKLYMLIVKNLSLRLVICIKAYMCMYMMYIDNMYVLFA